MSGRRRSWCRCCRIARLFGGGPVLLLPHGFSEQILAGVHQATGYTTVIADRQRDVPDGVAVICPRPGELPGLTVPGELDPGRLLLRMYTGGTTGKPQCWSKTVGNLFLESLYLAQRFSVSSQDRIVATVAPYHIYGLLYSVLLPLVSSATVLSETPSYPGEIVSSVRDQGATILVSVPAHYGALQGKRIGDGRLRLAISSAGMLTEAINRDFCRDNEVDLLEIYGSTETGGIAERVRHRGQEHFRLFQAVEGRIVDQRLAVRSPYISPEAALDGQGFFLGGDRITFHEDGTFALRGRVDHITKVGGKRVNLEEVRDAIKLQPGVVDAVAATVPVPGGREHQVVALIQGAGQAETLRTALAAVLEPYAVPRIIRFVDRIPLTPHGKYDRESVLRLFSP